MKRKFLLIVALSAAAAVTAASLVPLNISTGLWQVSMTSSINGMPPRTTNYTSCVNSGDLSRYPFTDPKANCTWNVVNSSGSAMQANGTCAPEKMGTVQFMMQLTAVDSQHVTGTGQMTAATPDGPMNGTYSGTGKWVSSQCPASQ